MWVSKNIFKYIFSFTTFLVVLPLSIVFVSNKSHYQSHIETNIVNNNPRSSSIERVFKGSTNKDILDGWGIPESDDSIITFDVDNVNNEISIFHYQSVEDTTCLFIHDFLQFDNNKYYVTDIEANCINDNTTKTTLKGVMFDLSSSHLKTIGDNAFSGCDNLTYIGNFPSSLISIGNNAFDVTDEQVVPGFTPQMPSFNSAKNLVSIGDNAFENRIEQTRDALSFIDCAKLTSIGNSAFRNCSGIKNVRFNSSIQLNIGDYAFCHDSSLVNCYILSYINTSNYMAQLGDYCFYKDDTNDSASNVQITNLYVNESMINDYKNSYKIPKKYYFDIIKKQQEDSKTNVSQSEIIIIGLVAFIFIWAIVIAIILIRRRKRN